MTVTRRAIKNRISRSRETMGVKLIDGERCYVCRLEDGWARFNIDGVWTVLGLQCRDELLSFIESPLREVT